MAKWETIFWLIIKIVLAKNLFPKVNIFRYTYDIQNKIPCKFYVMDSNKSAQNSKCQKRSVRQYL